MSSWRQVVLCADDYGLTEGVSRGILELAAQGRLSATSAMTNMPDWPRLAPALHGLQDRPSVGLHLNLTTGRPLGAMPRLAPAGRLPRLNSLMLPAFTGGLDGSEIRAEIERQLDAFEAAFGAPPAFVDGHQHVHVLPGIRQALLAALKARGLAGALWIRDPSDAFSSIRRRSIARQKALIVKTLATGFGRAARAAGFAVNEGFSGFSPLDETATPGRVFGEAFSALGARPVVMCHPGHVDDALIGLDPAVESRGEEFAYLASGVFAALLRERQITLVKSP